MMRISSTHLRRALFAAFIFCVVAPVIAYAVSVSPMSVFMDHRTRTGTMTLYNPNPLPEEIEVSFAFGYPTSDSTGNVTVPLSDTVPTGEPGATAWLRAFPRKLVLQPGQQQVIRILAQPPENLPDGEYWSRVLVTATGGKPPVEQQIQPDVKVAISMRTVVVGALNYRKGKLATGVRAVKSVAMPVENAAQFTIDLERTGQAAFLGRIRVELQDRAGTTLAKDEDVVSIYHTLRRRFIMPVADTAALRGATVHYTLETQRPELGQANIISAPAVEGVTQVVR
jgi:P pilus assembly chaperone PapD